MEIYERIKYLRTDILHMTRAEFGEKLGVSLDTINNIERNRLKKPEQKEPIYRLIAEKFGVSLEWLKTGEGEMTVSRSIGEEIGEIVMAASRNNPEEAAAFFKNLFDRSTPAEMMIVYEIAKRWIERKEKED